MPPPKAQRRLAVFSVLAGQNLIAGNAVPILMHGFETGAPPTQSCKPPSKITFLFVADLHLI